MYETAFSCETREFPIYDSLLTCKNFYDMIANVDVNPERIKPFA